MQMSFDPDGAHGMLTLGPWGGGSGGVAYAASIRPEGVKKLANEVGTAISAGAEACWDACTRDYNRQQDVQMQQAQMNFDGAMAVYDFLNDTGAISAGMAGYHSYQATREWQKAAVYATLPIPTLIDEYFAMAHLIKGAYHWYKCSGEAISWDLKN